MGGKEDQFDEYGQLAGGFEAGLAREKALEHAQNVLENETSFLAGLPLIWEIVSARFDEEEDCYKVMLFCHPKDVHVDAKAKFEYHIDAMGNLYPGTPILHSQGQWDTPARRRKKIKPPRPPKKKGSPVAGILITLSIIFIIIVAAGIVLFYKPGYIDFKYGAETIITD